MTAIIETDKLTKSYGPHRGIVDLDLEVDDGEVFGFLGPNGAGKTTTIRTLLDHLRPTSGRARIFGIDTTADPVAIHRRTGYLPGEFALYDRLTGGQTIEYFGNLRGGVDPAYRDTVIERLDLDPSRRFKEYSKGNKQKVGLVIAFQHRPELLILDEPTSGLDPLVQQAFYALSARPRPRAGRCSCPATCSPRWSGPATAWPSSATGAWSAPAGWTPSATWPTTRSSCASPTTSRRPSSPACPACPTWWSTTTGCGCGWPAR